MQLHLIRNATLRITYAGHTLLIDPYLAPKLTLPSYAGKSKNPMVDLPDTPENIIRDIEMVMVSHLHTDHFDDVAKEMLPKDIQVYCQPENADQIRADGFTNVMPIDDQITWQGITITRVAGRHGTGDVLKLMGTVSGFVLQAEGEPTVYWAGDTVWYDVVAQNIKTYKPDIIVTHSCGAVWGDYGLIVMDAEQTVTVCQSAPNSKVIATHMESLDHATVNRVQLREYAREQGISDDQLLIPDDGDVLRLN